MGCAELHGIAFRGCFNRSGTGHAAWTDLRMESKTERNVLSDCECIGTDSVNCIRALCNSDYADFSKCVGCGDSAWYFLADIFEVDIIGRIYR